MVSPNILALIMSKPWSPSPSNIVTGNELTIIINNIFNAATKGQVDKTISLIDDNNININHQGCRDLYGNTLLHIGFLTNEPELIKKLFERNIDEDICNVFGQKVIDIAINKKNHINLIIDNKVDKTKKTLEEKLEKLEKLENNINEYIDDNNELKNKLKHKRDDVEYCLQENKRIKRNYDTLQNDCCYYKKEIDRANRKINIVQKDNEILKKIVNVLQESTKK